MDAQYDYMLYAQSAPGQCSPDAQSLNVTFFRTFKMFINERVMSKPFRSKTLGVSHFVDNAASEVRRIILDAVENRVILHGYLTQKSADGGRGSTPGGISI